MLEHLEQQQSQMCSNEIVLFMFGASTVPTNDTFLFNFKL